jgi:hypothetical protein
MRQPPMPAELSPVLGPSGCFHRPVICGRVRSAASHTLSLQTFAAHGHHVHVRERVKACESEHLSGAAG